MAAHWFLGQTHADASRYLNANWSIWNWKSYTEALKELKIKPQCKLVPVTKDEKLPFLIFLDKEHELFQLAESPGEFEVRQIHLKHNSDSSEYKNYLIFVRYAQTSDEYIANSAVFTTMRAIYYTLGHLFNNGEVAFIAEDYSMPKISIRCTDYAYQQIVNVLVPACPVIQEVSLETDYIDPEGKVKYGFLDYYAETGSEGAHWIVSEYRLCKPYEDMYFLRDGDELVIYADGNSILWEGKINYNWEIGYRQFPLNPEYGQQCALGLWCHGIQEGFQPDDWAHLFLAGRLRGENNRYNSPLRAKVILK